MILVDSNVIIDVSQRDATWLAWSMDALDRARQSDELCINAVIYAEVSYAYPTMEALDRSLSADFRRLPYPYEAAFLAARAQRSYRQRGGPRESLLADFLIGAHAAIAGMRLLTRDPRRYRTAFPTVKLIAP